MQIKRDTKKTTKFEDPFRSYIFLNFSLTFWFPEQWRNIKINNKYLKWKCSKFFHRNELVAKLMRLRFIQNLTFHLRYFWYKFFVHKLFGPIFNYLGTFTICVDANIFWMNLAVPDHVHYIKTCVDRDVKMSSFYITNESNILF